MSEYDQQIDCSIECVGNVRRVAYVGLGLLGLVAGCLLINSLVTRVFWKPDLGTLSDRIAVLREHRDEIDTVFIGSSRIQSAVNPLLFDEQMAAAGLSSSSYNLWIPGSAYADLLFALGAIGEANLPNLKYVVIEPLLKTAPDLRIGQDHNNAYSARVRYVYTPERIVPSLALARDSLRPLQARINDMFVLTSIGAIHLSNLGVLPDIFLHEPRSEPVQDNAWSYRGHELPKDEATLTIEGFADTEPQIDAGYRVLGETEARALARFIARTRQLGAEPVFLIPPSYVDIGEQRAIYESLVTRFPDIAVISYIVDEPRQALYDNPGYWVDNRGHLGLNGSRYFSTQLARDWAARIGVARQPDRD